ncbi:hypothetical protein [Bacillus thuringiensis]|nr:hypothetical protein [Bacillus thuringiensis]
MVALIQVVMVTLVMKEVENQKEQQVMMDILIMKKGLIVKILE